VIAVARERVAAVQAVARLPDLALERVQRDGAVGLRAARGGRGALVLLVREVDVRDDDDAD
jgi:hypothetical protein